MIVIKKKSYFDGTEYRGYKVSLRLVRENLEDYDPVRLNTSDDVYKFMRELEEFDREKFYTIFMDEKNTVVNCEEISSGNGNMSIIHPKDVFKVGILSNAASAIFVHNHPSGDPKPSNDDKRMEKGLTEVGKLLGIRVLDNVIIGYKGFHSSAMGMNLDFDE